MQHGRTFMFTGAKGKVLGHPVWPLLSGHRGAGDGVRLLCFCKGSGVPQLSCAPATQPA